MNTWSFADHISSKFGIVHNTPCCCREKCPQTLWTKVLCLQQIVNGYAAVGLFMLCKSNMAVLKN